MKHYYLIFIIYFFGISCQSNKTIENKRAMKSWDVYGKLEVSQNGHYLQHEDGTPFLWLGGTSWGMTEWLSREDVNKYLDNRKRKGFNVIQVCLLWGKRHEDPVRFPVNAKNAYGHRALHYTDSIPDPTKPNVRDGGAPDDPNDYWDHVDYVMQAAAERNMYIALLPMWGRRYVNASHNNHSIKLFNDEKARIYGKFLGNRYMDAPNIIWVMGGDVNALTGGDYRDVYHSMAEGIIHGITAQNAKWNEHHPAWDAALFTYHPDGNPSKNSSEWFHKDPWLDFNMIETHVSRNSLYNAVLYDYQLINPIKPTVMGEGQYEGYTNKKYADDIAIRRQAYQTFFAGGAGHTYGGHHDGNGNGPLFSPYSGWENMLEMEGVRCFPYLQKFLEDQEWWNWISITNTIIPVNGHGELEKVSVKHAEKQKVLVYFPDNSPAEISFDKIFSGDSVSIVWFNTKNGAKTHPVQFYLSRTTSFQPPEKWKDAVLIAEK